jgi:hypothetical protein
MDAASVHDRVVMEFQPEWLTFEIQQALAQLPTRRHRETVLRLAEGQMVGRPMGDTFALPGVCSHRTWYGRTRKGKRRPGWKDDPAILHALDLATKRAQWWADRKTIRSMQKAHDLLALEAPLNVTSMIGSRNVLSELAASAEVDARDRIQAAEKAARVAGDMLSRAGTETATKEVQTFDLEDWAEKRKARLAEVEDLEEYE